MELLVQPRAGLDIARIDFTGTATTQQILVNYTITFTNGNLNVIPAPLTIAADDKTRVYGQANPPFIAWPSAGLFPIQAMNASFNGLEMGLAFAVPGPSGDCQRLAVVRTPLGKPSLIPLDNAEVAERRGLAEPVPDIAL